MKRPWAVVTCGLLLALGAGWIEAQQAPPRKQPPRKAKKVWTNDDFPERPVLKAEPAPVKAEAAPAKPVEAPAAESPAGPQPGESLDELERMEEDARRSLEELEAQRDAVLSEVKVLEEQRDTAATPQAQAPIIAQIREKQKQLDAMWVAIIQAQTKLAEIQKKKAVLQPPPEEKRASPPEREEAKPPPPSPPPL